VLTCGSSWISAYSVCAPSVYSCLRHLFLRTVGLRAVFDSLSDPAVCPLADTSAIHSSALCAEDASHKFSLVCPD